MDGQEKNIVSKANDKSRFFSRLKLGLKKTRGSLAEWSYEGREWLYEIRA